VDIPGGQAHAPARSYSCSTFITCPARGGTLG
jgi:hypothetical protein